METRFLKDALFGGMTGNAFKLGTVLTLGWFWARTGGCHHVYGGQDGNIDYDHIQAVMELDDSQVSIANQDLPADTIWHYVRRQASGCGLESADSPACIVVIDSVGGMIGDAPNPPLNLRIEGLAGGKLKLRWRYTPISQEIVPTAFRIYMDSGSGFDFTSPHATVAYGLGGYGEFEWTSAALTDGQLYRFCVRSYRDDIVMAELVKNGGFGSDSEWTKGPGWMIIPSNAVWEETQGSGNLEQDIPVMLGCTYRVVYKVTSTEDNAGVKVQVGGTDGDLRDAIGTYTEDIIAATADGIRFVPDGGDLGVGVVEIGDVSVKRVGTESQNTNFVAAVADAGGPNAITGLQAGWQES